MARLDMAVIGPSKNTRPERVVRMALVRMGIRHRLHAKDLPGRPDAYLVDYNIAIFVNGRFWHCQRKSKAMKLSKFWRDKIRTNARRDARNRRRLSRLGVGYLTIWDDRLEYGIEKLARHFS